jgi:hypothetical protein
MTLTTDEATDEGDHSPARLGYRIAEWSEMTGTSRVTTWRNIKAGKLKAVDYCGIKLIPDSERVRLGFEVTT